ncbi:MAG: DUF58 domain-containing protein [Lachnospiraceae bacterium]|jgi:hypothetical protein|nr:DUF58 domain-containing protein [Lachnospiraceae bacterium]
MTIIIIGLIAAALFISQKHLYRRFWNKGIIVNLRFTDDTVRVGGNTSLVQVVENKKWLPLPALKVKFQCSRYMIFATDGNAQVSDMYYRNDLFSLMPFRRVTRQHRITCMKRGYYGIRGIDLVGADLFLSQEMVESRSGETWIHVIPALCVTEELDTSLRQVSGEMPHRRHLLTDPFAFRGIREYTPLDEIKTVNWKASAKSDDWKVNVYDYTAINAVSLFINLSNRQWSQAEEQLERAIAIGAYLAEYFLSAGVNVSIYANACDCLHGSVLCMEEIRDLGSLEQIQKMLARLDLDIHPEPFTDYEERMSQQTGRMLIVISPDWLDEVQDMLCRNIGRSDIIWICPCSQKADVRVRPELKAHTIVLAE